MEKLKHIKLYENFNIEEGKPISDEDWKKFNNINKKYSIQLWDRKYLIDNGDGTFDYTKTFNNMSRKPYKLKELFPLPVRKVHGDYKIHDSTLIDLTGGPKEITGALILRNLDSIRDLKGIPKVTEDVIISDCERLSDLKSAKFPKVLNGVFRISNCNYLNSLEGGPKETKKYYGIENTNITSLDFGPNKAEEFIVARCPIHSLKGFPKEIIKGVSLYGVKINSLKYIEVVNKNIQINNVSATIEEDAVPLISTINDMGIEITDPFLQYDRNRISEYLKSTEFKKEIWFESLMYVGARAPEDYLRVCKDFPNETKFEDWEIEKMLESDLIDRKSTEADWKVVKDILNRTKKYDQSEYRDSKLDSEWKEIF